MLRTPRMGFWRSSFCKKLQLLETQATKIDTLDHGLESRPIETKTTSPDGVVAILDAMLVELRSPSRWWTTGHSIPQFLAETQETCLRSFHRSRWAGTPPLLRFVSAFFARHTVTFNNCERILDKTGFWSVNQPKTQETVSPEFFQSHKWAPKACAQLAKWPRIESIAIVDSSGAFCQPTYPSESILRKLRRHVSWVSIGPNKRSGDRSLGRFPHYFTPNVSLDRFFQSRLIHSDSKPAISMPKKLRRHDCMINTDTSFFSSPQTSSSKGFPIHSFISRLKRPGHNLSVHHSKSLNLIATTSKLTKGSQLKESCFDVIIVQM